MKKVLTVIIVTASMILALCSCTAEQAAQTAIDTLNSVSTSDSPEVMSVKGGYLSGYSTEVTVGDALDGFLSTPMWQYFQAESGEKIVQCTGGCTYQEQNVEVKIQFQLNDDDTFELYTMAINDLPQNAFMIAAFFEKVYEEAAPTGTSSAVQNVPNSSVSGAADNVQTDAKQGNSWSGSSEEYLYEYRLNSERFTESDMPLLSETELRMLLNALYAYHGYTFESETYRRLFGRMYWYTPMGKTMEGCESEFNDIERANKEVFIAREKAMGWR